MKNAIDDLAQSRKTLIRRGGANTVVGMIGNLAKHRVVF